MNNNKIKKIVKIIFNTISLFPFLILIFIIFVNLIPFLFQNGNLRFKGIETEATIIDKKRDNSFDDDDLYEYKISYVVDGIKYTNELDVITNGLNLNDKIIVYYDKKNPKKFVSKINTDNFPILTPIVCVFMIIFLRVIRNRILNMIDKVSINNNLGEEQWKN